MKKYGFFLLQTAAKRGKMARFTQIMQKKSITVHPYGDLLSNNLSKLLIGAYWSEFTLGASPKRKLRVVQCFYLTLPATVF